jgi:hypothetical protein
MMNGYEAALAGRFGGQMEKNHRPKLIRAILDRAVHRKWRQLAVIGLYPRYKRAEMPMKWGFIDTR